MFIGAFVFTRAKNRPFPRQQLDHPAGAKHVDRALQVVSPHSQSVNLDERTK